MNIEPETLTRNKSDTIKDSSDMDFMHDVIEASKDVPVIVDFWAPWCGPCKQLMPALERSVSAQDGKVKMVKINIDENPGIAGQLGVQSIPAVFAFKDGQPVDGFMGGQPESELNKFVARLTGDSDPAKDASALVARAQDSLNAGDSGGAAQDFAQALSLHPESAEALAGLARLYLDSGNEDGARELINQAPLSITEHPEIMAIRSTMAIKHDLPEPDESANLQAAVEKDPDNLDARLDLAKALAAQDRTIEAVEHCLYCVQKDRAHDNEAARKFLLTIFAAQGVESEISIQGRRALSSILFA